MRPVFLEARSLPIFPCRWDKKPACQHGFLDATSDPKLIEARWGHYSDYLTGVPTGSASDLAVIDIDPRRGGKAWLAAAIQDLPDTRVHATRSGGWHLLYRHPPGLGCSPDRIAPGVEIKGAGGYFIFWPTVGGQVLCDAPVAEFPQWVLELLNATRSGPRSLISASDSFGDDRAGAAPFLAGGADGSTLSVLPRSRQASYALVSLHAAMDELLNARRGERNGKLNARAYSLGRLVARGWITVVQVVNGLELACRHNLLTRDDGAEQVRDTIMSGLKAGMQRPYPDDIFRKAKA